MAITFSKTLSTTKLLNAFNNNVVQFSSDNVLNSVKCVISIGGIDLEITPINNVFSYNFKAIVKTLINSTNWKDEVLPTADFVVDNTLRASYLVDYTITFSDDSTENISQTYWFTKSVNQIAELTDFNITNQYILNHWDLTMWIGYPFDVARFGNGDFTLRNDTTGATETTTGLVDNDVERIWLSTGDATMQGDNGRMVEVGVNEMFLGGASGHNWNLTVKDRCTGTYLKWINEYGTWSYWLFNAVHKEDVRTRTVDTFYGDTNTSIDETYSRVLTTGKTAEKTRTIYAERLNVSQVKQIQSLFSSPRVELYNEDYGSAVTGDSWQTVQVRDERKRFADTKRNFVNLQATIIINQYTQI